MDWIKKHIGSKDDHEGAGSGDHQQGPNSYSQLEETSPRDHGTSGRGSADIARAQSVGNSQKKWNKLNPFSKFSRENRSKDGLDVRQQGGGAPGDHQEGESDREEEEDGQDEDEAQEGPVEAQEECLLTIPGAIAHLVDDQESPLLATGIFSIVRIIQKGSGIVILAHVGDSLHWPVTKDTPTVKLDPTHYFFSLPIPASVDEAADDDDDGHNKESGEKVPEVLTYGVTFPAQGYDKALPVLDSLLERYSHFSSPTLIHGDKAKEEQLKRNKEGGLYVTSKGMNILANRNNTTTDNTYGGMVIPPEKVASNGKKLQINEQNQAEFWKTMAPNVDDYGSSVARGIATGSGQIIKGIFWVRDSTVAQLDNGSIYMQSKLKANDKEHKVSPRVLRNLHRVRRMSRATDNVAKALLTGVLVTTGFFEGAIIKSRAGKKIFKLMPGEVALVSLDAFGKLFDAVDKTGRDVLQSTSLMTQNVVSHRFGEPAAKVAEETLATTGHVISTGWTVIRLRKALNPKDGAGGASRVTKTGMLKNVAKNKIMGGKK
ncbi:hypothetical protein CY35_02G192300 [Sphagnum magellanicum]|nr:hypothetical protein CY35_02G192300 [Sphagnum magellanicum]